MFYQKKTSSKKKSAAIKRFKYSPSDKKIKSTNWYCKEKVYISDTFEFDQVIKKEKPTLENYSRSDLIYSSNYRFYKYCCGSKILITFLLNQSVRFWQTFLMI